MAPAVSCMDMGMVFVLISNPNFKFIACMFKRFTQKLNTNENEKFYDIHSAAIYHFFILVTQITQALLSYAHYTIF